MRTRIVYAKIEKAIYEFDQFDIRSALMKLAGLPDYKEGRTVDFEWDSDEGKLNATIVVNYEEEVPST